jgi:hypothetical protein
MRAALRKDRALICARCFNYLRKGAPATRSADVTEAPGSVAAPRMDTPEAQAV